MPEVDVFDGIVIATKDGLRFIDADYVQQITRSHIWCSLDDMQASQLLPPDGAPVYRVDALEDSGHSLHDVLGRLFRRPHWTRETARPNQRGGPESSNDRHDGELAGIRCGGLSLSFNLISIHIRPYAEYSLICPGNV